MERLRDEGYLERSGGYRRLYTPTVWLIAVAGQLLDRLRLAAEAVPVVDELQALTGDAAHLAIPGHRSAGVHRARRPRRAAQKPLAIISCTASSLVS